MRIEAGCASLAKIAISVTDWVRGETPAFRQNPVYSPWRDADEGCIFFSSDAADFVITRTEPNPHPTSITILGMSAQDEFKLAREKAAQGQLVIVRPDGRCLLLPALTRDSLKRDMVTAAERIMPSTEKRNVAVIGDTVWAAGDAPSIQIANTAIPFFGLLMGLSSIGHSVWIFDGAANVIECGCREADVLIVDSARLTALCSGWQKQC